MVICRGIKGSKWFVSIGGFRDLEINNIENFLIQISRELNSSFFQIFDAEKIAGWEHLFFAVVNAVNAHKCGYAITRSPVIEAILYASCQDQISKGFKLIGISERTEHIAIIILSNDQKTTNEAYGRVSNILGKEDDRIIELTEEKFCLIKKLFNVSDTLLKTMGTPKEGLKRVLIERGALVSTYR
jgi:tRNA threonylcarbamoyladenosine modification (KEOPS) complex Cgi121 subunit